MGIHNFGNAFQHPDAQHAMEGFYGPLAASCKEVESATNTSLIKLAIKDSNKPMEYRAVIKIDIPNFQQSTITCVCAGIMPMATTPIHVNSLNPARTFKAITIANKQLEKGIEEILAKTKGVLPTPELENLVDDVNTKLHVLNDAGKVLLKIFSTYMQNNSSMSQDEFNVSQAKKFYKPLELEYHALMNHITDIGKLHKSLQKTLQERLGHQFFEESIKTKLSLKNPVVKKPEILQQIDGINCELKSNLDKIKTDSAVDKFLSIIHTKLDPNISNEHLDEMIRLIDDPILQTILRVRLNLLKEGDLVCNESQGQRDETFGINACAVICMKAVEHFLNPKSPPISTQEMMYKLMDEGIAIYKMKSFHGKLDFITLMEEIPNDFEIITPSEIQGIDQDSLQIHAEHKLPLNGYISNDLENFLNALGNIVQVDHRNICGVLTCNGKTIVISFDQDERPLLFDSHGRIYNKMHKGASICKFDNPHTLAAHMKAGLFKPDEMFQLLCIGKKLG